MSSSSGPGFPGPAGPGPRTGLLVSSWEDGGGVRGGWRGELTAVFLVAGCSVP